jgi:hypothetical protein
VPSPETAIVLPTSIRLRVDGETRVVDLSDPERFAQVRKAVEADDVRKAFELAGDGREAVGQSAGGFAVRDDAVHHRGKLVPHQIAGRIVEVARERRDLTQLSRFLDRLAMNPDPAARDSAVEFMERNRLPVLADGRVLAYKRVKADFWDFWTGKLDNRVGKTVSMPRSQCDPDPCNPCSRGLHLCGYKYLGAYHGGQGVVIAVAFDPRHFVAVPRNEGEKARTCEYEVMFKIGNGDPEPALEKALWLHAIPPRPDRWSRHHSEAVRALDGEEWERFRVDVSVGMRDPLALARKYGLQKRVAARHVTRALREGLPEAGRPGRGQPARKRPAGGAKRARKLPAKLRKLKPGRKPAKPAKAAAPRPRPGGRRAAPPRKPPRGPRRAPRR